MKQIFYFTKQLHVHSGKILYFNLIGMILVSIFEGIGLFLIIPLIGFSEIVNININENSPLKYINKLFEDIPAEIGLPLILGIYLVLLIGQSFFQQRQMILSAKIQQSFMRYLRIETYKSLILANWNFFIHKRKTDISNALTTELNRVGSTVNLFLQFIAALVFTFIQIIIACWLSLKLTALVIFFGLILIYFSRKLVTKASNIGKEATELSKDYLGGITDHFNGIKDIKSNNLEEQHIHWFVLICKKIESNVNDIVKLKTTSQLRYKVVSSILVTLFIYVSIQLFKAQPAHLMLIVLIFTRLWPRFSAMQSNLETMSSTLPSFNALINLQNESLKAREINNEIDFRNSDRLKLIRCIECRDVSFRYNYNSSFYALNNINVSIPSNKMTAVVGQSGAGKSTLIDLLMGLNEPELGNVFIDGEPLNKENLLAFRRAISYVPQDPFLFNGTIRNNLKIVKSDATERDLWEALSFSASSDFVRKLPLGLDTVIGDRGVRLSGGERQRLVLARAILRKPSILVLDEATSALDSENERKIQNALESLKGEMTIIVIAHRLSTIRSADQVIVLDKGRVIQCGEYQQLAEEKRSMFRRLLMNQTEVH